jgi:hypothetical protein
MADRASHRSRTVLVVLTVGMWAYDSIPALANGIDLPDRQARQGEEVPVTGHAWLTCCPPNTPVEHVRLFLVQGDGLDESERVLLFDVAADVDGAISTAFTVPYVAPARYRLEACGGLTGQGPCLPEGHFTVLPRPPSPTEAAPEAPKDSGIAGDFLIFWVLVIAAMGSAWWWFVRQRR